MFTCAFAPRSALLRRWEFLAATDEQVRLSDADRTVRSWHRLWGITHDFIAGRAAVVGGESRGE